MHEIYSHATCVRVWLGDMSSAVREMLPFLAEYDLLDDTSYEYCAHGEWSCHCLNHTGPAAHPIGICLHCQPNCRREDPKVRMWDPVRRGLNDLLSREWFGRAWMMQEAILARRAVMCFGGEAMEWDVFHKRSFRGDRSGLQIRKDLISEVFAAQEAIDERRYGLSQFLILAWPREAWDPRDKVFSLFGLLTAQPFEVDYERSVRDVYVAATRACITTEKNLRVLGAAGLVGTPSPIPTSVEDSKCPYFGTCSHANGHCSPGSPTPPSSSTQRDFPSWVPDYRASGCKDTAAQTDWYMTVRNVDSVYIGEATTFQAVDDTSDCLLLTGLVLGRFSSHAFFKSAPYYAEDGVTEICRMVHAGAFVEFPSCTVKYFNHAAGFKAIVGEEEQRRHLFQFAQAVRQHDRQSCECSEQSRKRPVEPIYSVANGKLPPHCTDGDWLCILGGAAAPSILRPLPSPTPPEQPNPQSPTPGCRYPASAAFTFVGNMRDSVCNGKNDNVELMGISKDALVTYMYTHGVANVKSRSQAREELARGGWGSSARKERYQKRLQAMRRRGVRAVRGVLHLH